MTHPSSTKPVLRAIEEGQKLAAGLSPFQVQEHFGKADVEVVGSETRTKLDELLFLRRCVFFSGVKICVMSPRTMFVCVP